ncbi:MAG: VOC family protein [Paracoccaceae bacterium]|nr:VOC family protein [Paracoccaceae bacterium]
MQKVTGIGGFFFRSHEPKKLSAWYSEHFGIDEVPNSYDAQVWQQASGSTVFAPFTQDSAYFGDFSKSWMINFRVDDLEAMVAQLEAAGIKVEVDGETYPNGFFARLVDPEGNPIQLWQPKDPSGAL